MMQADSDMRWEPAGLDWAQEEPVRVLVIDDDPNIHRDFERILTQSEEDEDALERHLFGASTPASIRVPLQIEHRYQGPEGWQAVAEAVEAQQPYSIAFVDMRMPPGPDGLQTIERIWELDSDIYVVVCTAYSDHSWSELSERLRLPDRWFIMRKPVDVMEIRQLVAAISHRWVIEQRQRIETTQLRLSACEATETARREIEQRERSERELREKEDRIRQLQRLEAMGAVTGGVAHEFNNLLQVIQSYVAFPLEVLPPATSVVDDLQIAQRAVRRATEITGKLLKFSRRKPVRKTIVSLNRLVREFVEMWRPLLGSRIEVRTSLEAVPATVHADAELLEQVLTNLCLNARDAMPDGGWIEIATRHAACEGHRRPQCVELWMTDTGSGMDDETRNKIFDPFFTTKAVGQGSGLGLAVVYGIVQEHEGEIEVQSEPGIGTTFCIRFPLATETSTAEARREPTVEAAQSELRGHGEAVLIAEDDPTIRDAMVRVFQSRGFSCLAAADGDEAWELFRANHTALRLVVLDEMMPGKTGLEVFGRIRRLTQETPVLLCTGYDLRIADTTAAADDPRLAVVAKPFETRELLQVAAAFLQSELHQRDEATVLPASEHSSG